MPVDISIIDTSSIIHLRELPITRADLPITLSRLTNLVNTDKLVYPKEVIPELGRYVNPDSRLKQPLDWARSNSSHATRFDVPLEFMKSVLEKVPTVNDPDKLGVEEADPYVLALAVYLRTQGMEVTVLTEETHDRPDKMSMTTACGHLRLIRLPIEEFLKINGVWIRSR